MSIFVWIFILSSVRCDFSDFHADHIHRHNETKKPTTGFYANSNLNRTILMDSQFYKDPAGGCEALIQLSIALATATGTKTEVCVTIDSYHPRYLDIFPTNSLIHQVKSLENLKPGDLYIINEGILCPTNIPTGVQLFVFVLADYMGCLPGPPHNARYISHNHYLTRFNVILPNERIIHPYLSVPTVEKAFHTAGLQRDGVILYERSLLKNKKENLVMMDNDVPSEVKSVIVKAAEQAGGKAVELSYMTHDQILDTYAKGKIVIDWCMRGSERCPLEAALFGAIAITNNCSTGSDFSDFPIPPQYLMHDHRHQNDSDLVQEFARLFSHVFLDYWSIVPQFEPLRRSVLDHSPASMTKEAIRFLATTHIDDNYHFKPDEAPLMPYQCSGC